VTEIRSYRRVFDLERRVYSVDRLRLNPAGVPVRGVVYFAAVVAAALVCSSLPLLGGALGLVPWYLRDLLLPALSATFMALIRVEGRTFHHAAYALMRFTCARRRLLGGWRGCGPRRWHPPDVLALPDGSGRSFRELRYTGPGAVLLGAPHERRHPARRLRYRRWLPGAAPTTLTVRPAGQECASSTPEVILLAPGTRMRVHGAPDGSA
jgi:hypothetical protein